MMVSKLCRAGCQCSARRAMYSGAELTDARLVVTQFSAITLLRVRRIGDYAPLSFPIPEKTPATKPL